MMIQKFIFKCECLKSGDLEGLAGFDIYKLFTEHIKREALSREGSIKPFSISPLRGKDLSLVDGKCRVKEGVAYSFGITGLNEEYVENLSDFADSLLYKELQLGDALLRCQGVRSLFKSPKSYLRFMTEAEVYDKIWFKLLTPLCMKVDDGVSRHPKPDILMEKLLRKWNALSDHFFPASDFKKIKIQRYRLMPEVYFGEGLSGSKGDWEFVFANGAGEDFRWMVNALARFASLANLGDYTEKGMGQVIIRGSVVDHATGIKTQS